jgi:hypothetical protein
MANKFRSPHSIVTTQRMKEARERDAAAERKRLEAERQRRDAATPPDELSFAAIGVLQRLRIQVGDVAAIIAFAEAPDAYDRWNAAKGSRYAWTSLQEFVTEARNLID